MAGGSKGWRRRCTCPQLQPSLSCPAWPVTPVGSSPGLHGLYVSCHCHPLLSSPGQGTAAQKIWSVIKTGGHRGPTGVGGAEGRELRLCPAPKSLNSDVSYQLHPYGDAQRQMKRDRHWLALYFSCGDISFVVFLTEPAFIPALRWDKDLVDKSMSIPVGTLKNCRCHVHNKGKETTTYSNYIFKVSGFKLS